MLSNSINEGVMLLKDPSEYRPDIKECEDFRDFRVHNVPAKVKKTYDVMHSKQTLSFVQERMSFWGKHDHAQTTVMEAVLALNGLVDESDPDADFPNSMHAFQTAEGIRKHHPDKEWFQLTGLIHDIGKVMALWGEPQWATVGDTFVVGCAPDPSVVFGVESFRNNPDTKNEKLNTKFGIYSENCGLENVLMSWGHDEYLYRVLKANVNSLPEEALYVIRFHSFYPWHWNGGYMHLCNNKDLEMLNWVKEFNQFDLYTKSPELPEMEKLIPYYQGLIDKYIPGTLRW
ncbi:inositol oxygenase-like [Gigantopelta aegis]|uniref:inositol oxygenase-like n=1 Tax=Gigantopelta aegis TaxID=1735272 RepID=UPI001B88B458|nr:inositol oxygenase-like [Gigantopelta aegis]